MTPAKKKPDILTLDDVSVIKLHEVEKKSLNETAEIMNVSRETVKRIKKKPAYRDFVLDAIEKRGYSADTFAEQIIALTEANKQINVEGELEEVDDNPTRMKAVEKMGDILGVDAPKEYDVRHGLASATDEEIAADLEKAESRFGVDGSGAEPPANSGSAEKD